MKAHTSLKIGMALVAVIILCVYGATSCKNSIKEHDKENSVTRTHSGNSVSEIEYNGATYIIIETHRGVGICPKVNQ